MCQGFGLLSVDSSCVDEDTIHVMSLRAMASCKITVLSQK